MTDPVILLGTQSNGETLPVQVNQYGQLVAEGIQGPPGPEGPPGIGQLPPDPYEGALLGWLNGELSWIGTPPVPVPPGVYGPIIEYDESGYITVEGTLPEHAGNGVYIWQCDAAGILSNPVVDYLSQHQWSDNCVGQPYPGVDDGYRSAFDANTLTRCSPNTNGEIIFTPPEPIPCTQSLRFYQGRSTTDSNTKVRVNNSVWYSGGGVDFAADSNTWNALPPPPGGALTSFEWRRTSGSKAVDLCVLEADGKWIVDTSQGIPYARINQKIGGNTLTIVPVNSQPFTVGEYLWIPEQRVAPWVLYGNDPTLLIDHLRSK